MQQTNKQLYDQVNRISKNHYTSPRSHYPTPTTLERRSATMYRYFVQKRSNPRQTIIEVDTDQFAGINVQNLVGINGVLWTGIQIKWTISGRTDVVLAQNQRTVHDAEIHFPGITSYLSDLLQFHK